MQPFLRWYFPSSQKEKKKEKLMVFKCERGKSCAEKKENEIIQKKKKKKYVWESSTYDLPIFTSVCRER
jgi:hypothetical protein